MIDEVVAPFASNSSLMMSTLRRRIDDPPTIRIRNVTKVVVDLAGLALPYFSRAPIPRTRQGQPEPAAWRDVGLYAYRRQACSAWPSCRRPRWSAPRRSSSSSGRSTGIRIPRHRTIDDTVGVDTPEDLARVRRLITAPVPVRTLIMETP